MTSIILNSREVKGVQDGSITLLVRPLKWQPEYDPNAEHGFKYSCIAQDHARWGFIYHGETEEEILNMMNQIKAQNPFRHVGDRIWVKETWQIDPCGKNGVCYKGTGHSITCPGNDLPNIHLWRSSTIMPKILSRITIETKSVRVVRVQDMSEEDAKKTGIHLKGPIGFDGKEGYKPQPIGVFKAVWQSTYGKKYPYETNPYVFLGEIGRVA